MDPALPPAEADAEPSLDVAGLKSRRSYVVSASFLEETLVCSGRDPCLPGRLLEE